MLSARAAFATSNLSLRSCFAHCATRGTYHSSTHATKQAIARATARSGFTIAKNPMPLARIAMISEWRQNVHIV